MQFILSQRYRRMAVPTVSTEKNNSGGPSTPPTINEIPNEEEREGRRGEGRSGGEGGREEREREEREREERGGAGREGGRGRGGSGRRGSGRRGEGEERSGRRAGGGEGAGEGRGRGRQEREEREREEREREERKEDRKGRRKEDRKEGRRKEDRKRGGGKRIGRRRQYETPAESERMRKEECLKGHGGAGLFNFSRVWLHDTMKSSISSISCMRSRRGVVTVRLAKVMKPSFCTMQSVEHAHVLHSVRIAEPHLFTLWRRRRCRRRRAIINVVVSSNDPDEEVIAAHTVQSLICSWTGVRRTTCGRSTQGGGCVNVKCILVCHRLRCVKSPNT